MKIWGNTIVKNEDRYLYFAVKSVINYLDKLIIFDTGSTDETVKIINILQEEYPKKIIFKSVGEVDKEAYTRARQDMLDLSKGDWVFILDGDEVWWEDSIKKLKGLVDSEGNDIECIVNPVVNIIGDIYHYQEEAAGEYKVLGKRGHFNIRAVNKKIPGLHFDKPYGQEGFFDAENKPIQERDEKKIRFLNAPLMHFTYVSRSTRRDGDIKVMQRKSKMKYEIGERFNKDFKYPEVLNSDFPSIISSPWIKMGLGYSLRSAIQTPLKKIKRRIK